jgi:hypothetical protein
MTASPNVATTAIASTQKVQTPTQLGRHSDARENAVERESSSEPVPSSKRTSEKRWCDRTPVALRFGMLAGEPEREKALASSRRQTRSGRPLGTSRSRWISDSLSFGAARSCPDASTSRLAASSTSMPTSVGARPPRPQIAIMRADP